MAVVGEVDGFDVIGALDGWATGLREGDELGELDGWPLGCVLGCIKGRDDG